MKAKPFQITLVGDQCSGKTQFLRCLRGHPLTPTEATISPDMAHVKTNRGLLRLLDTSGSIPHFMMNSKWWKDSDAFLLLHDARSKTSTLQQWVELLRSVTPNGHIYILQTHVEDSRATPIEIKTEHCTYLGCIALTKQPNLSAILDQIHLECKKSKSWLWGWWKA